MVHKLTLQEFWAVKRALAAGARHVEIARELNLSVWTIDRIADDRKYEAEEVSENDLPVDDAPPDYVATNLRRCGGCGAMIYVSPCIACQVAASPRVAPAPEVDDALDNVEDSAEIELAPCGRRRRTKRTNLAYRAKMAQRGRDAAREPESFSHG